MQFEDRRAFVAYSELEGPVPGAQSGRSCSSVIPSDGLIVPVVLSGGGGSRLWPFSTNETPKQFLPLVGSRTLFRQALDRVEDRRRFSAPVVVGNLRHADLCESELEGEGADARLILEPCARNTAAAVAMAAALVREEHAGDALMLVMPSDHVIEHVAAFHAAIQEGEAAARAGRLVTFGVRPTSADTSYGYLRVGGQLPEAEGVMKVERFIEKPPVDLAEAMVEDGEHLWNSGIFLFRADSLMEELNAFAPSIARCAEEAVGRAARDGTRIVPPLDALSACASQSIDYAVMEHSSRVAVVPMSPGWSDLGSWDALAALVASGGGAGRVTVLECEDCFIQSDRLHVAALGVRDLIIVASGQNVLVLPRGRSQEVKRLLSAMEAMAA